MCGDVIAEQLGPETTHRAEVYLQQPSLGVEDVCWPTHAAYMMG